MSFFLGADPGSAICRPGVCMQTQRALQPKSEGLAENLKNKNAFSSPSCSRTVIPWTSSPASALVDGMLSGSARPTRTAARKFRSGSRRRKESFKRDSFSLHSTGFSGLLLTITYPNENGSLQLFRMEAGQFRMTRAVSIKGSPPVLAIFDWK